MEQASGIQTPAKKVFKTMAIWWGTLLGGPLVAGYLATQNFKVFDQPANVKKSWIIAVVATAIVFAIALIIPGFYKGPWEIIPLLYSAIAYYLVEYFQGKKITDYINGGGQAYPLRKSIGAGALAMVITFFLFWAVVALGGEGKRNSSQLRPDFSKASFDTLHTIDLVYNIFALINVAKRDDNEKALFKRFSPGQRAVYVFWNLDEQITYGGLIQFYGNNYGKYEPEIVNGLNLIGDKDMLNAVTKAEKYYRAHKSEFDALPNGDWEPLEKSLKEFESYDQLYFKNYNHTMVLFEKYIRQHPADFVTLK